MIPKKRVKHRFDPLKYGKDRISFLEAAAIKGKREIPPKYGKDRISFLEAAAIKGKSYDKV